MIIRQAEEEDFENILRLIQEFSLFQQTPEKVTIDLEQMKAQKDLFKCLVAQTSNGDIIGFASFYYAYYSWSGKAMYLDDLYVMESHRKQSVGKKLLDAVIDLAKREQCKKVRWQVSGWNSYAIAFYKKMGANIDSTEINCDLVLTGH